MIKTLLTSNVALIVLLSIGIIFLLIPGLSEFFKSYWAAKKGDWPGEDK